MYLYFDARGVLKEVINDTALRQANFDNYNRICIYQEGGINTSNVFSFKYVNIDSDIAYPENPTGQSVSFSPTPEKIPYDAKRDLKFFNYTDKYTFLIIPTSFTLSGNVYDIFDNPGTVKLSVYNNTTGMTFGLIVFNVEDSANASIQVEQYITLAQWNYLKDHIDDLKGEATWGRISGTITDQEDLNNYLEDFENRITRNEDAIGAKANDNAVVHNTGNETISGTKTFNNGIKTNTVSTVAQNSTLTFSAYRLQVLQSGSFPAVFYTKGKKTIYMPDKSGSGNETVATTIDVDTGLSAKQDTLIGTQTTGQNLRTVNNQTLLGSGNIEIEGTHITIDSQLSTTSTNPVQNKVITNELQNVREIAEGKCKTYIISYDAVDPFTNFVANRYKKVDGTTFATVEDLEEYLNESYSSDLGNGAFDGQDNFIDLSGCFIVTTDYVVIPVGDHNILKKGDIILVVETDVPDRWFSGAIDFYKLETSKVDLTNYATITYVDDELAEKTDLDIIAPNYSNLRGYVVGDKVIYEGQLYTCNTAITTAEDFNSSHWTAISVSDGFVDLDGTQTITGQKSFDDLHITYRDNNRTNSIKFNGVYSTPEIYVDLYDLNVNVPLRVGGELCPNTSAAYDIGTSGARWRDGYFSGNVYAQNTLNVINASDITNNTLTQAQYDLITNGKPTLISGDFLTKHNMILFASNDDGSGYDFGMYIGQSTSTGSRVDFGQYRIVQSSKVITLVGNPQQIDYTGKLQANVGKINEKNVPAYPTTNTNPQVLTIGANGGNLSWENHMTEWYGTQTEYDNLGTYDSNTIYNILES